MKYNKYQADYIAKKEICKALTAQCAKIERDYILSHNIVNKDGVVPVALWLIDDDETFKKACDDIGDKLDEVGSCEAEKALKIAEDNLIRYGLSIMPVFMKKEKQILENACFGLNGYYRDIKTRVEMIDCTMKFDTSTVPAWVRRA